MENLLKKYSGKLPLKFRRIVGCIAQDFYPNNSWCSHCNRPWPIAKEHLTPYGTEGRACFPLCQDCWEELTIKERLRYHRRLLIDWRVMSDKIGDNEYWDGLWNLIKESVEAGL